MKYPADIVTFELPLKRAPGRPRSLNPKTVAERKREHRWNLSVKFRDAYRNNDFNDFSITALTDELRVCFVEGHSSLAFMILSELQRRARALNASKVDD